MEFTKDIFHSLMLNDSASFFFFSSFSLPFGKDLYFSFSRGYIEAIREIELQVQGGFGESRFDDIVVACGR